MTQQLTEGIFKYLTAFQLMILVFTIFMNMFGFDEDREVVVALAILAVTAFVYKKGKDNKVELGKTDVTPLEEMTVKKAVSIIQEAFHLKDKDAETIALLTEKVETQTDLIQLLQQKAEVNTT